MAAVPENVNHVLQTLEDGGFEAYLVGGCLRDMLLSRDIHDWDVATTALGADVMRLFPKTVDTGARFGTVTVMTSGGPVEVTTLRSDGVYSDNRRPDDVRFVGDLVEDLKRRDFTINAMAMARDGVLSDPFDGQGDLKRRLIRCVGKAEDRFSEDALRMFRALRFSAQLGFEIEQKTMAAIGKCAPLCSALSAERVRDETEKILMSQRPELAFSAVNLGLFAGRLSNRPAAGAEVRLPAVFPPDTSLWDARMRWAAFTAVLAREGLIGSAADFLRWMRLDAQTVKHAGTGVSRALAGLLPEDTVGIKRLLADIGEESALCDAASDEVLRGGDAVRRVSEVISGGECYSLDRLAVSGGDLIALGVPPSVRLGKTLKTLLNHVIEHPEDNKRDVLMRFSAKII